MIGNKNTVQLTLKVNDDGTIEATSGKLEGLGDAGDRVSGKLGSFAKAGATAAAAAVTALAAAITVSVVKFAEFESALANVSTLVDTSEVDMAALKAEILNLDPALGSATEQTEALYQALSAGIEPAKAVEFVGQAAMAAKAGLTDTFTAVDAGTSVLNAFGLQSQDATRIYDQMFTTVRLGKTTFEELSSNVGTLSPIMAAANIETNEMFAAVSALTAGGIGTAEATTYLRQSIANIIKPTKEASDMAEALGIQFDAEALKAQGLAGFLDTVKQATGGNVSQMSELFGSTEALTAMLALTGQQADKFAGDLAKMETAAGSVDTAFDKQQATVQAAWDTMKNAWGQAAIKLGEEFAPTAVEVLGSLTDTAKRVKELVDTDAGGWITTVTSATESWAKHLGTVADYLFKISEHSKLAAISEEMDEVESDIARVERTIEVFERKFENSTTTGDLQSNLDKLWELRRVAAELQGNLAALNQQQNDILFPTKPEGKPDVKHIVVQIEETGEAVETITTKMSDAEAAIHGMMEPTLEFYSSTGAALEAQIQLWADRDEAAGESNKWIIEDTEETTDELKELMGETFDSWSGQGADFEDFFENSMDRLVGIGQKAAFELGNVGLFGGDFSQLSGSTQGMLNMFGITDLGQIPGFTQVQGALSAIPGGPMPWLLGASAGVDLFDHLSDGGDLKGWYDDTLESLLGPLDAVIQYAPSTFWIGPTLDLIDNVFGIGESHAERRGERGADWLNSFFGIPSELTALSQLPDLMRSPAYDQPYKIDPVTGQIMRRPENEGSSAALEYTDYKGQVDKSEWMETIAKQPDLMIAAANSLDEYGVATGQTIQELVAFNDTIALTEALMGDWGPDAQKLGEALIQMHADLTQLAMEDFFQKVYSGTITLEDALIGLIANGIDPLEAHSAAASSALTALLTAETGGADLVHLYGVLGEATDRLDGMNDLLEDQQNIESALLSGYEFTTAELELLVQYHQDINAYLDGDLSVVERLVNESAAFADIWEGMAAEDIINAALGEWEGLHQTLTNDINRLTMSPGDYQRWQIDQQYAAYRGRADQWADAMGVSESDLADVYYLIDYWYGLIRTSVDLEEQKIRTTELLNESVAQLNDATQNATEWANIADSIGSQLEGLLWSEANPASAQARLGLVQAEIEGLLQGGSIDAYMSGLAPEDRAGAAARLQELLGNYLELAQDVYQRPSSDYQAIFEQTVGALGSLEGYAEEQQSDYELQAEQLQTEIAALERLQGIQDGIIELGSLERQQLEQVMAAVGAMDTILTGITDNTASPAWWNTPPAWYDTEPPTWDGLPGWWNRPNWWEGQPAWFNKPGWLDNTPAWFSGHPGWWNRPSWWSRPDWHSDSPAWWSTPNWWEDTPPWWDVSPAWMTQFAGLFVDYQSATLDGLAQMISQLGNMSYVDNIYSRLGTIKTFVGQSSGYLESIRDAINARNDAWNLPTYATGIDYVPQDQVAYIHQGEAVLTRDQNEARRSGGGGDVYLTVTVDARGNNDPDAVGKAMRKEVESICERYFERGKGRPLIQKVAQFQ